MSQLKVRSALEKQLATFATLKSLPVVWENISTIPSGNYLKAALFPADTKNPSIGASHRRYAGAFRITYFSTALNKGVGAIEAIAQELEELFPRGLQLTKDGVVVHITHTPSVSTPGYAGAHIYISVEMFYRADVII